jgi:hypothetical protein
MGHGGDELVMSLDNTKRHIRITLVQVTQVTIQTQTDHVIALPQAPKLHVVHVVGEVESLDTLFGLSIPDLAGLVCRASHELGSIGVPGERIDSHLMSGKVAFLLASLSVVEENLLVLASRGEESPGRVETDAVHESGVVGNIFLPLEGGPFEPLDRVIFRSCDKPVGTGRFHVASCQLLGCTADLSDTRTRVGEENTTEFFFSISDNTDPLAVRGPGNIGDGSENDVNFELADTVFSDAIPNTNGTAAVSGGDVVSAWSVSSNGGGVGVLGVLVANQRVGEVAHEHGVSGAIQDIVSLGVTTEVNGQTSGGRGERPVHILCSTHQNQKKKKPKQQSKKQQPKTNNNQKQTTTKTNNNQKTNNSTDNKK